MAAKLKNVAPSPAQDVPRPAPPVARLTPEALRSITSRADPTQPPAVVAAKSGSTLVTLRLQTALADAIADAASAGGTTQKVIVTRALAAAGYPVSQADLEDRTPRRRR